MMKWMMRGVLIGVIAIALGACNTVKGFGKDVKKAGEQLEEAAERHD